MTKTKSTNKKLEALDTEIVDFIIECSKKENKDSYLIPVLHKVQEKYGYLSKEHMQQVAELMGVPASTVSGVSTFYHFFRLEPQGKYKIQVCLGTACYVKGAKMVAQAFKDELGIEDGETTTDGLFSLEPTRCLGVCGLAPVVMINDDVHGKLTPEMVAPIIKSICEKEKNIS